MNIRDAVIVSAVRTPVGRAHKGSLKDTRPDTLGALAIKAAMDRVNLDPDRLDDVIMGCAMPEAEQGMNVARIAALAAGVPYGTPAMTMNRFCSSGLQTIATAAERIMIGAADVIVAGGLESMTMVPMGGHKYSVNPDLYARYPEAYTAMGITAENVAKKYGVTREDQDAFAVRSHERAIAAIEHKRFADEIVPVDTRVADPKTGAWREIRYEVDELPRPGTTLEVLAGLKPAFDQSGKGTVTPGNASPLSDGAAAAVVMSADMAKELGLTPLARFVAFQVAGVPPEIMGVGPVAAIPKVLKKAGLGIEDVALFEINEAFASQALYSQRELGIPDDKLNVNGGAIALGHPLGATGAKLTATLLHELKRRGGRYGVVSMCIGGGMGAAAVFERA